MSLRDYSSSSRLSTILIVMLALIVVALVALIIAREMQGDDDDGLRTQRNFTNEREEVLHYYGNFFRTHEEQAQFEKVYFSPTTLTVVGANVTEGGSGIYNQVCNETRLRPTINEPDENRGKRSAPNSFYIEAERYHGCCESRRKFVSPEEAFDDLHGAILRVKHFDDERQFFLSEDCWHKRSCTLHCGCRQQAALYQALVYNPACHGQSCRHGNLPEFVVRTIQILGGCKCINGEISTSPFVLGRK